MTEYKVKSDDRKKFCFTNNDNLIGNLIYEQRYNLKSIISLANGLSYHFEPKSDSAMTVELKDNASILLNFKMNSKGNITITTKLENVENDYILKHTGVFKSTYTLVDSKEEELLVIQTDFKWDKFNQDYNISTSNTFDKFKNNDILLLTMIHCINYYQYVS
jgi:hypothetical protein